MPRGPKIELWRAHNSKWYFHKVSANGKVVGDGSQGYLEKRYAKVAINREHPGIPVVDLTKEA